jgi:hypothetical protein
MMGASLIALCVSTMRAQNTTVQYERVFESRKLAGIVYAGHKAPGNQLSHATIELCGAEWKECVAEGISDSGGRFNIVPRSHDDVYYLRIWHENYNPVLLKVHLSASARHDLEIAIPVAT